MSCNLNLQTSGQHPSAEFLPSPSDKGTLADGPHAAFWGHHTSWTPSHQNKHSRGITDFRNSQKAEPGARDSWSPTARCNATCSDASLGTVCTRTAWGVRLKSNRGHSGVNVLLCSQHHLSHPLPWKYTALHEENNGTLWPSRCSRNSYQVLGHARGLADNTDG